jgi:hypothetical protein
VSNELSTHLGSAIVQHVTDDVGHVEQNHGVDTARDDQLFGSFQLTLSNFGVTDSRALSAARAWYADFAKQADKQQAEQDTRDIKACLKTLLNKWGADHAANMRLLNELMEELPEDVALPLYESRDGDGVHLLNNPAFVMFLVGAKRAIDSPVEDVHRTNTDATELEEIKKMMGNSRSDYWRGPRAARLQARYLELISR